MVQTLPLMETIALYFSVWNLQMKVRCANCGDWTNIGLAKGDDRTNIGREKLGWCSPCWKQAKKIRSMCNRGELVDETIIFNDFGDSARTVSRPWDTFVKK